jgi:hypothetical protein
MTKSVTLENSLFHNTVSRNQIKEKSVLPESESMKMLIRYSMALQVVRTKSSGNCYIILN